MPTPQDRIQDRELKLFTPDKIKDLDGNKSKLYTGRLSPGCQTCIEGTWACIFINGLCTRNCFFCPQDRLMKKERQPILDGITLKSSKDCMDFLNKFKFKGVGFSGGEPFLAFDLLIEYIKDIRKTFKNQIYVWMYTNGDLVTKDKLVALKKAGLDEIRFDLSARKYDFKPIILAKKIFDQVLIETPMVPEEYNKLLKSVQKMKDIPLFRINLHQLHVNKYNKDAFLKRNYTFYLHNRAVHQSKIKALEFLKYCVKNSSKMEVNYCSDIYKNRYQQQGFNLRYAKYIKEKNESLSPLGRIRQIYIKSKALKNNNIKKIIINPFNTISTDLRLLKNKKIYICYFNAVVKNNNNKKGRSKKYRTMKLIEINKQFKILGFKSKIKEVKLNLNWYYVFHDIFIKKNDLNTAFNKMVLRDNINFKNASRLSFENILKRFMSFYNHFEDLEYLGKNLI